MEIQTAIISFFSGGVFWEVVKRVVDFKTGEVAEDRRQRKQNRFDLSTEILKIINEGSSKNWNKKPNNMEHINYIGRQLEIEDPGLSEMYIRLISRWNTCADKNSSTWVGAIVSGQGFPPDKVAQFKETEKFIMQLRQELTRLDQEITTNLRKWRK